jgi:hypothetical protein
MHRSIISWYEDDLVIAKDMIEHPTELGNDRGRSGLCVCTCPPTVTSFRALNEHESLLSSLSLQEEVASAPQTHDMSRGLEDASTASEAQ